MAAMASAGKSSRSRRCSRGQCRQAIPRHDHGAQSPTMLAKIPLFGVLARLRGFAPLKRQFWPRRL
jgi:hypothetical protein